LVTALLRRVGALARHPLLNVRRLVEWLIADRPERETSRGRASSGRRNRLRCDLRWLRVRCVSEYTFGYRGRHGKWLLIWTDNLAGQRLLRLGGRNLV